MQKPDFPPTPGEIIQTSPDFKWPACLLIVSEARSWGVIADLPMPEGIAPIRLDWADFELTGGHAVFVCKL